MNDPVPSKERYVQRGRMVIDSETQDLVAECWSSESLQLVTDALNARHTPEPPAEWQPIETAPKDRNVFFWIMPNEGYRDTSGNAIVSRELPHMVFGIYGRWSSLMKATLWHESPTPPPGAGQ
jgi:hypothetical protein